MSVRFGVVGTGYWAETVHLPGLASRSEVEIAGFWGRNNERAEALARKIGIRSFQSYDDLLEAVDAISFAVAPEIQPQLAIAAANFGKNLILEKPLSLSSSSARDIAAAIERNALAALIFYMRRFVPEIENAIESTACERWDSATVRIYSASLLHGSPYARSVWRQTHAAALWDIGPHVVSILTPVLGPIEDVEASCGDDNIIRLTLTHPNGATANVSLTLHADPTQTGTNYNFTNSRKSVSLPDPELNRPQIFATAVGELIRNIETGQRTHRCDMRLGIEAVDVLTAASQSLDYGGTTPIARNA